MNPALAPITPESNEDRLSAAKKQIADNLFPTPSLDANLRSFNTLGIFSDAGDKELVTLKSNAHDLLIALRDLREDYFLTVYDEYVGTSQDPELNPSDALRNADAIISRIEKASHA